MFLARSKTFAIWSLTFYKVCYYQRKRKRVLCRTGFPIVGGRGAGAPGHRPHLMIFFEPPLTKTDALPPHGAPPT